MAIAQAPSSKRGAPSRAVQDHNTESRIYFVVATFRRRANEQFEIIQ